MPQPMRQPTPQIMSNPIPTPSLQSTLFEAVFQASFVQLYEDELRKAKEAAKEAARKTRRAQLAKERRHANGTSKKRYAKLTAMTVIQRQTHLNAQWRDEQRRYRARVQQRKDLRDEDDTDNLWKNKQLTCNFEITKITPPTTIKWVNVGKKRQTKILNQADHKIFLDWAKEVFTTKGSRWEDVLVSWGRDADGGSARRESTGQERVVLNPSERHLKSLSQDGELEFIIAEPGTSEQQRAMAALKVRVKAGLRGLGHKFCQGPSGHRVHANPARIRPTVTTPGWILQLAGRGHPAGWGTHEKHLRR